MGEIVQFPMQRKAIKETQVERTPGVSIGSALTKDPDYKERFFWLAQKYNALMTLVLDAAMAEKTQEAARDLARLIIETDAKEWQE